jgi:twinkle protein
MRYGQHKVVCPSCGPQRKKKGDKTLSVKVNDEAAVYQCWHCQEQGVIPLSDNRTIKKTWQEDRIRPVAVASKKKWDALSQKGIEFLASRGISLATATKLGIKSAMAYIQSAGASVDTVVFSYMNKTEEYAAKLRWTGGKGFTSNGAPASLWNLQNVIKDDWLIICEGEMDAATLVEAGYESATSIPLGAVIKVAEGEINPEEDGKFRFVWDAKKQIDAASRIVICCDADGPGQAAAEEIARRIGKDRVWTVEYPEDCKDANDVWLKHGQSGIDDLIGNCIPWPISGLYDSSHFFDQLDDIYANGMGRGESTGYPSLDELYTISPGMLTIVTGHPSSGKSELVDQIMVNLAKDKGWKFAVSSFENEPRIHIAKLISKYMRKPFFVGPTARMEPEELEIGKDFVRQHFSFIYQADGAMASMDSILERMKAAVMRYGIRGVVIDPYNYIQKPSDVSETDWISVMLTRVRLFAQAHGLHVWFVAHPAKMMRNAEGKVPAPKGYDISGSAAWFAKADHGITVHRPDPAKSVSSEVHSWKSRFSWLGKQGQCTLYFNTATSTYSELGQDSNAIPEGVFDPFADIGSGQTDTGDDDDETDVPF